MSEGPVALDGRQYTASSLFGYQTMPALTLVAAFLGLPSPATPGVCRSRILSLAFHQRTHRFLEIVFSEVALLIDDEMDAIAFGWEEIVLEGRRSVVGVDDVAWLVVGLADPFCELHSVGDGGGQEDVVDFWREQDDGLFPYHTTLLVTHVVDLVENNPGHFAHHLRAPVQHGPQNLVKRGRDERAGQSLITASGSLYNLRFQPSHAPL